MRRILSIAALGLLTACGGGSDGGNSVGASGETYKSYDCSVFPDQFLSPLILPYQIGE